MIVKCFIILTPEGMNMFCESWYSRNKLFQSTHGVFQIGSVYIRTRNILDILRATIAQWIRPCLPSCSPRLESQSHYLSTLFPLIVKCCTVFVIAKRTKINEKRPVWPIFKKLISIAIQNEAIPRHSSVELLE